MSTSAKSVTRPTAGVRHCCGPTQGSWPNRKTTANRSLYAGVLESASGNAYYDSWVDMMLGRPLSSSRPQPCVVIPESSCLGITIRSRMV